MGHNVLGTDHHVVSRAHNLALRQTNCMSLDYFFDVSLGQGGRGGEVTAGGKKRGASCPGAEGEGGEHVEGRRDEWKCEEGLNGGVAGCGVCAECAPSRTLVTSRSSRPIAVQTESQAEGRSDGAAFNS
jgi:hypothetical protein